MSHLLVVSRELPTVWHERWWASVTDVHHAGRDLLVLRRGGGESVPRRVVPASQWNLRLGTRCLGLEESCEVPL